MGVNKNCLFVLYLFILYFVEVRFLKASQYVRKTITQLHQWRRLLQQGARRRTRTRGHPSSSEHSQANDEELHEPLQSEEEEKSPNRGRVLPGSRRKRIFLELRRLRRDFDHRDDQVLGSAD